MAFHKQSVAVLWKLRSVVEWMQSPDCHCSAVLLLSSASTHSRALSAMLSTSAAKTHSGTLVNAADVIGYRPAMFSIFKVFTHLKSLFAARFLVVH